MAGCGQVNAFAYFYTDVISKSREIEESFSRQIRDNVSVYESWAWPVMFVVCFLQQSPRAFVGAKTLTDSCSTWAATSWSVQNNIIHEQEKEIFSCSW